MITVPNMPNASVLLKKANNLSTDIEQLQYLLVGLEDTYWLLSYLAALPRAQARSVLKEYVEAVTKVRNIIRERVNHE